MFCRDAGRLHRNRGFEHRARAFRNLRASLRNACLGKRRFPCGVPRSYRRLEAAYEGGVALPFVGQPDRGDFPGERPRRRFRDLRCARVRDRRRVDRGEHPRRHLAHLQRRAFERGTRDGGTGRRGRRRLGDPDARRIKRIRLLAGSPQEGRIGEQRSVTPDESTFWLERYRGGLHLERPHVHTALCDGRLRRHHPRAPRHPRRVTSSRASTRNPQAWSTPSCFPLR